MSNIPSTVGKFPEKSFYPKKKMSSLNVIPENYIYKLNNNIPKFIFNSNNKILSFNLDDYLWHFVLSNSILQKNIKNDLIKRELKIETNKAISYLKKEYDFYEILDTNILNSEILKDHIRKWKFSFKKTILPKEINRMKYSNVEKNIGDEKYILDLDKELNILTDNNEEIIKKIKVTSYQAILGQFTAELYKYFNCSMLTNGDITLKLYFKLKLPGKTDEYVVINIGKYNDDIISNIKSYYILRLCDGKNNTEKEPCKIYYDICRLDFNIIMNFTKNKIDIKYKINYTNDFYKNIVIKLPELFKGNNYLAIKKYKLLPLIYDILFSSNIAHNIEKQKIFYNYIYKLLKNIKDEKSYNIFIDTIKFLHKNCNLIENNIIKNKNILNKSIDSTIPVTKNIKDKVRSDFLIVSYNEEAEKFTYNDCLPIIFKILDENPSFIFVCTQESKSGNFRNIYNAGHYQHVLGNHITQLDYYVRLTKIDASVIGIKDKNVRTRIYINTNNVRYDIFNKTSGILKKFSILSNKNTKNKLQNIIKEDNSFNLDKNTHDKYKHIDNRYIITSFGSKKSIESGLGSDTGLGIKKVFTLYKGSIFARLEFTKKIKDVVKDYKIIVVNSHLFYKKSGSTGVEEREKELTDIIKEFKLIEHWREGYNIFFCGDMNFRLNKVEDGNKKLKGYESIISTYLSNNTKYKEKSSNILKLKNELYNFLFKQSSYNVKELQNFDYNIFKTAFIEKFKNYTYENINLLFEEISESDSDEIKKLKKQLNKDFKKYLFSQELHTIGQSNEPSFYSALIDSIDKLGTHLSSKYYDGRSLDNIKFYKYRSIDKYSEIFEIFPKKNGKNPSPRVPSQTDRIIYALPEKDNNIKISPYNFNVYLFPDKSDHKMISLSFELCDDDCINNNVNINSNKVKGYATYTPSSATLNESANVSVIYKSENDNNENRQSSVTPNEFANENNNESRQLSITPNESANGNNKKIKSNNNESRQSIVTPNESAKGNNEKIKSSNKNKQSSVSLNENDNSYNDYYTPRGSSAVANSNDLSYNKSYPRRESFSRTNNK